jgi:hypothetical protein
MILENLIHYKEYDSCFKMIIYVHEKVIFSIIIIKYCHFSSLIEYFEINDGLMVFDSSS